MIDNQRKSSSEMEGRHDRGANVMREETNSTLSFPDIIGESPAMQRVLESAKKAAVGDATVLIRGEAGTGKELVARALHHLSARRNKSFVRINCTADGDTLESALFGREDRGGNNAPGSSMGARESADQGSVFLDEVGNVPFHLQAKLLQVLQKQEFQPAGSSRVIRVNVRLIVATKHDLARSVVEGKFRSDLFYRLNVFPIYVPPLRERREDIPLLVRRFAQKFARRMNKHIDTVSDEIINVLTQRDWPGNVRELENLIQRSVASTEGSTLRVSIASI
jgi:formate hydrogenlyase transcriptional activator